MDVRRRNMGSQMASALNQESTKPLRNHQRSNIMSLRALQEKKRDAKVQEMQQQADDARQWKMKQFENVKPRFQNSNVQDAAPDKHEFLRKNIKSDSRPGSAKSRPQSANSGEINGELPLHPSVPSNVRELQKPPVPRAVDAATPKKPATRNFIRENSSAAKPTKSSSPDIKNDHVKSFDKIDNVPTYISEIKNKLAEEKRQKSSPTDTVPSGFRVLGEDERLETLAQLKIKHAEAESAYMKLPLKIETEGQKQRQAALQKQIAEYERLRKLFDKPNMMVEL